MLTFKPQINELSKEIMKEEQKRDVSERLYEEFFDKEQRLEKQR